MNSIQKINDIMDVSKLPNELSVKDGWDVIFVVAELDPIENTGYVPPIVMELLVNYFGDSDVWLNDAEPISANEFKFQLHYSDKRKFHLNSIDDFYNETGLWAFVAEFEKDGSFVVGLDQEFVVILSPKEKGFISSCASVAEFKRICLERFRTKNCEMNQDIFESLIRCIYTE
jgi:hypothetical protein